jgi:CDP-diacylglycerol---glycerol-3-phosphate 3-phosphatidyltransferase
MADHPVTLTDRARALTAGVMTRLGAALAKMGVHPDAVTIVALMVVTVGAVFIGRGQFQLAGVILLFSLPLDAVDGAVARAMQRKDRFGEMLDSSMDRYADGFIFAALSYYFAVQDQFTFMLLALAALLGSSMVSYTRARAEGLGISVKIGLLSRMERVAIILVMLLVPDLLGLPVLETGLVILAVGTNFTALQRLWYVYRALKQ